MTRAEGNQTQSYSPFVGFDMWSDIVLDEQRWQLVVEQLGELEKKDLTWLDGPFRAAAYQSGAIENLHPGDRGLTMTLIDATATWQSQVNNAPEAGGPLVTAFITAGVEALHMALDIATTLQPLSESWIRQLHQIACGPQQTYRVNTPEGFRERELPKGSYKEHDNHVDLADGGRLWFAPTTDVRPEMERLMNDISSDAFQHAHPVLQAAFVHHAFTHIHPFADGNGRVARILASVYLLRGTSLPLFLFADRKQRYIDALAAADNDRRDVFVMEILRAVEDLVGILLQRQRASNAATSRNNLDAFTKAIDDAITRARTRHSLLTKATLRSLTVTIGNVQQNEKFVIDPESLPTEPFLFTVKTSTGMTFQGREDELWPTTSMAFELRIDAWLDQIVEMLKNRLKDLEAR
jgi:Fic family protein